MASCPPLQSCNANTASRCPNGYCCTNGPSGCSTDPGDCNNAICYAPWPTCTGSSLKQLNGRQCFGNDAAPSPIAYGRVDPFFNQTLLTFNYAQVYLNNNFFTCPWNGSYPW